jgi:FkbM family methyltransferase
MIMSKLLELPNDLRINALSEIEAKILYHQIFVMESYSQSPIQLHDGDYVFDVGANIGLCSIFLARSACDLKIFAFEPIPETFAILQANTQDCDRSTIECFNLGLSDRPRSVQFQFDRGLSVMSSMYPDEIRQCVRSDANIYDWAMATVQDLISVSQIFPWLAHGLLWLLKLPILRSFGLAGLSVILWWMSRGTHSSPKMIDCQLSTVSEMMRQRKIDIISLMKIDTEGSELDVLLGIEPQDWPKIKQFVVEVHDIDRRVDTIAKLLVEKGYQTEVREEEWHVLRLMNIYTIYAVRV